MEILILASLGTAGAVTVIEEKFKNKWKRPAEVTVVTGVVLAMALKIANEAKAVFAF